MGLSDWVGIFTTITFIGFASAFYEVATRAFDDRKLYGKTLRTSSGR